jgi:cupin 2 domain-containing protein
MTTKLFTNFPSNLPDEIFTILLEANNLRIERIVSHGHSSPGVFWYDQADDSSVSTSENRQGNSTVVGSVESKFHWKQSLGK